MMILDQHSEHLGKYSRPFGTVLPSLQGHRGDSDDLLRCNSRRSVVSGLLPAGKKNYARRSNLYITNTTPHQVAVSRPRRPRTDAPSVHSVPVSLPLPRRERSCEPFQLNQGAS